MSPKIIPDSFGWFMVVWRGETLQCFRTESECRAFIAETARIRKALVE